MITIYIVLFLSLKNWDSSPMLLLQTSPIKKLLFHGGGILTGLILTVSRLFSMNILGFWHTNSLDWYKPLILKNLMSTINDFKTVELIWLNLVRIRILWHHEFRGIYCIGIKEKFCWVVLIMICHNYHAWGCTLKKYNILEYIDIKEL